MQESKGLQSGDVSCRVTEYAIQHLARAKLPTAHLTRGLTYTLEQLQTISAAIPWDDYLIFYRNCHEGLSPEQSVALCSSYNRSRYLRPLLAAAGHWFKPSRYYELAANSRTGVLSQIFRCLETQFLQVSEREVEIVVSVREGFSIPPDMFWQTHAIGFGAVTANFGLSPSIVTWEPVERGAVFHIRLPVRRPVRYLFQRVAAWFRRETVEDVRAAIAYGQERGMRLEQEIEQRKLAEQRETEHVLRLKKLAELSLTLSGEPSVVFERVASMIGELFSVRVVCLSQIVGDQLQFRAVNVDGQIIADAGSCPLNVTPCATVKKFKEVQVIESVATRFPEAAFLQQHHANSYCGFPSLNNEGHVVAVTCLLDDKPREYSEEDQHILRIIGQRLSSEIERSKSMTERRKADEQVRATLREKESLLKEIHHRVKNNLQVISSLLSLQSSHHTHAAANEVLSESQNRIRAMALVHETLYRSDDFAKVNLSKYLSELCGYLFQAYGVDTNRIQFVQDLHPASLSLDKTVTCGLLVTEVVSNSLKYAFPSARRGSVRIGLHSESDGRLLMLLADDGIGLPNDTCLAGNQSLGLQLVSILIEQLGGELKICREGGTAFEIAFVP